MGYLKRLKSAGAEVKLRTEIKIDFFSFSQKKGNLYSNQSDEHDTVLLVARLKRF